MRSTHACTPSFALFFSIFTSVVVYSRTNQLTPNTTKQVGVNCLSTWLCLVIYNISHDLHSCAIKKKKMRSTHACTPSFRNFSTQYSRRLLSILAQPIIKNIKHDERFVMCCLSFNTHRTRQRDLLTTCTIVHINKKKMRSTHACTPSFATFLLNIHVGCCLFSHTINNKMTTKNSDPFSLF